MKRETIDALLHELNQQGCPVHAGEAAARLAKRGIVVTVEEIENFCRMREELNTRQRKDKQGTAHTTGTRRNSPLPWWTPEYHGE